ncbi:hypothetical protein ElyMa_005985100 [Elysia marginata]|uniref:FZ domain-containing protein n=1 Tax=Elysia marginata TaxID=1093978 RepID=A0AAV4GEB5_9GAST|nr:hypothetical protein ElyMa_005985100 [Elysia marginata]
MISFPNILGHNSLKSARPGFMQFIPLIKVACSPQLEPFLCNLYFPPCQEIGVVPPCRSLCRQARSGCEEMLNRFGYPWPRHLACDRFPEDNCLNREREVTDPTSERTKEVKKDKQKLEKVEETSDLDTSTVTTCHSFASPLCSNIAYNMTSFPNLLGHGTVDSALQEMNQFYPLIKVGCSSQLEPFLCSLYFPPCQEIGGEVPPCRSLCLHARSGCEQLMQRYGFTWPSSMVCDRFPEKGFCVDTGESEIDYFGTPGGTYATRGDTLTLQCRLSGYPWETPSIRIGHETVDGALAVLNKGKYPVLESVHEEIRCEDSGEYVCEVDTSKLKKRQSFFVAIKKCPPVWCGGGSYSPTTMEIPIGGEASLHACVLSAYSLNDNETTTEEWYVSHQLLYLHKHLYLLVLFTLYDHHHC